MKLWYLLIVSFLFINCVDQYAMGGERIHPFNWDSVEKTSKPWTRWWWLGSSISEAEISRQLKELKHAGFGGVEIQPIYPEDPSPIPPIRYLSGRWAEVLLFALEEAERLGLGVDLTLGSGWPFGGPWLKPQHAARKLTVNRIDYDAYMTQRDIVDDPDNPIECVVIIPKKGHVEKGKVLSPLIKGNKKIWTIPPGNWIVYTAAVGYTGQQVKRATVGSEGPVLDHFSRPAFDNYVVPFEKVLSQIGGKRPRSTFNDSYEVYGADWTPELFKEFEKFHGYDLRPYLPIMFSDSHSLIQSRLIHDYREIIHYLFMNKFCIPWTEWSHRNNMKTKFQAHGSPGNLVDLYGISDIPETEGFGKHGIRIIEGKFSSSAAHLHRRKLCSSETFTWLDEHFHVSLDMMRKAVDLFYLAGINHVFYHGTPFSPADDPYPGPVFYASTHAGETNTWWHHVRHFNEYMTRIQAALQAYHYDPDVLLYFPVHDSWKYAPGWGVEFDAAGKSIPTGKSSLLQLCEVNRSEHWFQEPAPATWETANLLQSEGWQFDYASDKVLTELCDAENGEAVINDMRYKTIIFAGCREVEESTLEKIRLLLDKGVTVIFIGNIPNPVEREIPGSGGQSIERDYKSIYQDYITKSCILIDSVDLLPGALRALHISNETMLPVSIKFIRYHKSGEKLYFLKNISDKAVDTWLSLTCAAKSVLTGNPLTGAVHKAVIRDNSSETEVHVKMEPYASLLLLAVNDARYDYLHVEQETVISEIPLEGSWKLSWTDNDGNRFSKTITQFQSWTNWKGMEYFSGEVVYETAFTVNGETDGKRFVLHAGELHESAEIMVNGESAGVIWTSPYTLDISGFVHKGENEIQIKVRNLMANRIIGLDREGVRWRKYFFVNIDYKPFDASEWNPLPSGLIGPVTIVESGVSR